MTWHAIHNGMQPLTVGQLKALIAELPDDLPVTLYTVGAFGEWDDYDPPTLTITDRDDFNDRSAQRVFRTSEGLVIE